jgi:hypothetical protein
VKLQALALECRAIRPEEAIDHLQAQVAQAVIALAKLTIIHDKIQKVGF